MIRNLRRLMLTTTSDIFLYTYGNLIPAAISTIINTAQDTFSSSVIFLPVCWNISTSPSIDGDIFSVSSSIVRPEVIGAERLHHLARSRWFPVRTLC